MSRLPEILVLGTSLLATSALSAAEGVTIQSRSGQFFTHGPPVLRGAADPAPAGEPGELLLDPALLAVSCEAIKNALLRTLQQNDQWVHPVYLNIEGRRPPGDRTIHVQAVRFLDGWQYRLGVPRWMERRRLVETVVQVLLLEMAQRNAQRPVADPPPWLGDGLSSIIESRYPVSLALSPYSHAAGDRYQRDPLRQVRQHLRRTAPLTMEQLNWPSQEERFGEGQARYEACAHLLVHELLRLPRGPASLEQMLAILPGHLNWQTAFLEAFQPPFSSMLELDKWWSLVIVQMTGRDLMFTWSVDRTWTKLEEILSTPVRVRMRRSDLPMSTQASLQSLIGEWEFRRQLPVLRAKISQLQALRLRAAQSLVDLVDAYRLVLEDYLQARAPAEETNRSGISRLFLPFRRGRADTRMLVQETAARLNELDDRRATTKRLMRTALANQPVPPPGRSPR